VSTAPVETPAEETPADAPVEEPAQPAETPAPADAPAETPETPAETKPAEKPTEESLVSEAQRNANRTMAAARRAEARVQATKDENVRLNGELTTYKEFVGSFKTDPVGAIRRIGFGSLKAFLEHCSNVGEGTVPDEAQEFKQEFRSWRDEQKKQAAEAAINESKSKVFSHVAADKTRWARTATKHGNDVLWEAIETYYDMHGEIDDDDVLYLADEVEKDLRAEFGEPSAPAQGVKAGSPPAVAAAPAGRTSGNTLTNKGNAGSPAKREYSMDPDERRRQINEELKREGLLDLQP
jgi:predicted HicB family RNase H-like nuclease